MDFEHEIMRYFSDSGSTRRLVLAGSTLLGIAGGVLGTFALLRKQSLLGDAMAHAALPGICLVFLVTGAKDSLSFLLGASLTGLLGAMLVLLITRHSRIKEDTAIGLILSVFFGVGIVLLSIVQRKGMAGQSGLDKFLFGKAASLLPGDLYVITTMCALLLTLVWLFYKEFKILTFDPDFGASIGMPIGFWQNFLTALLVLTVMIGLQAVGVVLMVAIIIIPAAAARQWTDKLGVMIYISAFIGGIAGASASVLSTLIEKMPTGPVMALVASGALLLSIFVAPCRGLIPRWWRQRNYSQTNLGYFLCESGKEPE